jgi:hypothetical protein
MYNTNLIKLSAFGIGGIMLLNLLLCFTCDYNLATIKLKLMIDILGISPDCVKL